MAFKRARGATTGPEQQGRWQEPGKGGGRGSERDPKGGKKGGGKGDVQKKKESGS